MTDRERFPAFVSEPAEGVNRREVRELSLDDLPDGELLVRVAWSSVNYKDALAAKHDGRVATISPLVPGIDLAGEVVESSSDAFPVGTAVAAHGYDIGTGRHGGYGAYARIPAQWALALPDGLSARDAMVLGTAGFTAAESIHALQRHGLESSDGPVLVTGATGGVGSAAVAMLSQLGFDVTASTGKASEEQYLRDLGASEVISREETSAESKRPIERERWAAAVDCVGGSTLAYVLRTLRYGGAVAASGLTGGVAIPTTVIPFILRGVTLLGIDSVQLDMETRREIWQRLAGDLRPRALDAMATEIGLEELDGTLDAILAGEVRGRTVVRLP